MLKEICYFLSDLKEVFQMLKPLMVEISQYWFSQLQNTLSEYITQPLIFVFEFEKKY